MILRQLRKVKYDWPDIINKTVFFPSQKGETRNKTQSRICAAARMKWPYRIQGWKYTTKCVENGVVFTWVKP